jgi:hypothetical protein
LRCQYVLWEHCDYMRRISSFPLIRLLYLNQYFVTDKTCILDPKDILRLTTFEIEQDIQLLVVYIASSQRHVWYNNVFSIVDPVETSTCL